MPRSSAQRPSRALAPAAIQRASRTDSAPGVRLPPRYALAWRDQFESRVRPALRPGVGILDVGSGRRPALPPAERPDSLYVGLDISLDELRKAPEGSYDEFVAADVVEPQEGLRNRFDLVVSWQVLEHVKPLDAALDNLRSYLRPGGRMVALLSGSFSAFALVNKVLPASAGVWLMERLLHRDADTVFPAHYDRCHHAGLVRLLEPWSRADVVPLYRGANYFRFSRRLQVAYITYESWASRNSHCNLATHYLLDAQP